MIPRRAHDDGDGLRDTNVVGIISNSSSVGVVVADIITENDEVMFMMVLINLFDPPSSSSVITSADYLGLAEPEGEPPAIMSSVDISHLCFDQRESRSARVV
jgi:hypothetical protein